MNILIVNFDNKPQFVGGIKRVVSNLARHWQKNNNNVVFCCFCDNPQKIDRVNEIPQFFFPDERTINSDENYSFLSHFVQEQKINVILNPFCDNLGIVKLMERCRKAMGIPVVSALHFAPTHDEDIIRNNFFIKIKNGWALKKWTLDIILFIRYHLYLKKRLRINNLKRLECTLASSDKVVLLSEKFFPFFDKSIFTEYNDKITYINNPADYAPCQQVNKGKIILWCGRVEFGMKRTDRIIQIWKNISKLFPDWKLVVMGNGATEFFDNYSKGHEINNIIFTGFCNNPAEWYKKASVLCVTSNTEGWHMGIIETAAHRCPSIAYNSYSAITDLMEDGITGFLIPAFDENIFEQKLSCLMRDDVLCRKMGNAAYDFIQKFSIDNIAPQWLRLFEDILRNK